MIGRKQSLKGKKVFITGAGSGIGEMTAEVLAARGAVLYLTDINLDAVSKVGLRCRWLAEPFGGEVYWSQLDVTDRHGVQMTIDWAAERMDGLDIVFANAGIGELVGLDGDARMFDRIMGINTTGVLNTVDACSPHIRESGGYVLVNASMGGIVILPLMGGGYSPSKAATSALGQALNLHFIGTAAKCGVLFLAEHNTPLEQKFEDPVVKRLMRDNPLLRKSHKKRNPLNAVQAVVRGMEHRSLYVHAPRYTVFARYFPAVVNWVVRTVMVQNPQPALEMLRARTVT
jgi:NAD(P)-dependent dehydrogenase (short-subunit alcohol dehydrogenase family)